MWYLWLGFIIVTISFLLTLFWQESDESYWMSDETKHRIERYEQLNKEYYAYAERHGYAPSTRELWNESPPT